MAPVPLPPEAGWRVSVLPQWCALGQMQGWSKAKSINWWGCTRAPCAGESLPFSWGEKAAVSVWGVAQSSSVQQPSWFSCRQIEAQIVKQSLCCRNEECTKADMASEVSLGTTGHRPVPSKSLL